MKRRKFIKNSFLATMIPTIGGLLYGGPKTNRKNQPFNLLYAPHFGMFNQHSGSDLVDQIQFMYDMGFRSLEDNGMKDRSVSDQNRIAKTMNKLDMKMGVFVAHKIHWDFPNLTSGDKKYQDQFVKDIKDSIDVAKRVNSKWMTVVPGHVDLGKESAYQTANVIEALRRASEVLEPHDLIMVLEPLNWWSNHAGQFFA